MTLLIVRPTNLVAFLVIQETNGTLIVRVWIIIIIVVAVVFDRCIRCSTLDRVIIIVVFDKCIRCCRLVRANLSNVIALESAFDIAVNAFGLFVFLFKEMPNKCNK